MEEALVAHGHNLRRPKCKFWTPAADVAGVEASEKAKEAIEKLGSKVERVSGGIVMLGSSAGGRWKCEVGDDS
eukprot:3590541-Lingulodinium_polyedra.AAC.1